MAASLTPTVFSWNINVSGKAKARKKMLETVISRINPDVMLLQETLRSIKEFFKDAGIPKKTIQTVVGLIKFINDKYCTAFRSRSLSKLLLVV